MITNLQEVDQALSDPVEYQRLIPATYDLCAAIRWFPNYMEPLIQPLFANANEYKRLIKNSADLRNLFLEASFYRDEFIYPLIKNPKEIIRIELDAMDLGSLIKDFPNLAPQLILAIIQNVDVYHKIFCSVFDFKLLCFNAKELSLLSEFLVTNLSEFSRIVKSEEDLETLRKIFPSNAILSQPTLHDAIKAIQLNTLPANRSVCMFSEKRKSPHVDAQPLSLQKKK